MVAFFVRRLIGGVVTWLVATFVLYSLLVSPSIPIDPEHCNDCFRQVRAIDLEQLTFTYSLEKPWPANYLTWLFDPNGTTQTISLAGPERGRKAYRREIKFARSGLLLGDFGYSMFDYIAPDPLMEIASGTPALAVYGLDLQLFLFLLTILASLMLVAVLQRRHRPHVQRSIHIPANARWRPAELWTTS